MNVIDLFTVQIIMADSAYPREFTQSRLAALMDETEENLTDLLPPGYRARIRRWDHDDEDIDRECDHKWRDYSANGGDFKPGELTCKYCGATKGTQ